jgi:hypothetical protein
VLRVSVVREIFSAWACACSGVRSNPRTENPIAPATPVLTNVRLETSITQSSVTEGQEFDFADRDATGTVK